MSRDFIDNVQYKAATVSVGISTVRGQPAGTMATAQDYLGKLDLSLFADVGPSSFRQALDSVTEELRKALPSGSWGVARKCLNIFLRDSLYNFYLRPKFNLGAIEDYLEVPLDGFVSKELKSRDAQGELPKWPGVGRLDPDTSWRYQHFAESVAAALKTARVHLDVFLWTDQKKKQK